MILGIVQARYSSSRLPGKVLRELHGKPMLIQQMERVKNSELMDQVCVATSVDPSDDMVAETCATHNFPCQRGDLNDVLDRFYQIATSYGADHIVRLTGDCPLSDPKLIDQVIKKYLDEKHDYCSNTLQLTFPDGLDVEVFSYEALKEAWTHSKKPSEREHVTPFIHQNPDKFSLGNLAHKEDLSKIRITVDEPEDFEVVEKIFDHFHPENTRFGMNEIISFLRQNPEILKINSSFEINEGYKKSLKEDEEWMNNPIKKSFELQEKAKKIIPGMTQLLSKRPDLYSYGVWPGYYSKAKGTSVWDLDGNQYTDMSIGGIGANILGYCDPDVDRAVLDTVQAGSSSSLVGPEEVELAELLIELHPWAEKVRFGRTGGEAMTMAVRIARAATGKSKLAFCGYHGWHDWYLSANLNEGDALGDHLLSGLEPAGVPKELRNTAFPFRYNKIEELEDIVAKHGPDLGVIVLEPIRSQQPEDGFLQKVREIATKTGAVLVVDEISAGFRMNTGGAHLILDLEPDIAVFSKALGNGYPIAAVIGKDEVMEAAQKTFISSTYWTERIGPSAAIAMLKKHRANNVGEHLMKIGTMVQDGWKKASQKTGIDIHVGGIPPLSHFSFEGELPLVKKALFVQETLSDSFLAATSFYSMYAHNEKEVSAYISSVERAFSKIKDWESNGKLESQLKGKPSVSGFQRLT